MVGPNYKPPATTMPAAYREADRQPDDCAGIRHYSMSPAEIRWWRQLGDAELTNLVEKSMTANYGVAVAEARLREARAGRQMAQALLYPQVSVGASALRYRLSDSVISLPGIRKTACSRLALTPPGPLTCSAESGAEWKRPKPMSRRPMPSGAAWC